MFDERTGLLEPEGRVVMVSGANRGFGLAIAQRLHRDGYRLSLGARRLDALKDAVASFADAQVLQCRFDAGDADSARDWVDRTVRHFGRLDALVNNAGIIYRHTAETATDEEWDRLMAVNLTAVFRMSRAAVRAMKRQGGGAIVNIASDWGLVGGRNALAYCASKGAVVQMTRAMALDHAKDKIRVNCVCPGEVDTPMLASGIEKRGMTHEEGLKFLGDQVPLGRVARPEEIAKAVVYLASDESSYMTGAMMSVDGGSTAA